MDALFEGLVDRLKTSGRLADSALLEIVHSAMLDAHKRTVSEEKRGLERLHQNARFHELSIMELECCLNVVREEAENNSFDQRYEFGQLLSSLLDQQDLMRRKLEELEVVIAEKDRELTRRKENEFNLRLAFQVMGKEVDKALKEYNKYNSNNQSDVLSAKKESNSIFDELKSSVEEEVSKIKMKLENGRDILTGNLQKLKQGSKDGAIDLETGVKQLHGLYNIAQMLIGFEEMIADVSILKENLKSSFEMMESTISLFESKLEENQLQMDMEREMLNILIKKFAQEAGCNNDRLDLIGARTPINLQSTKENLEEAATRSKEVNRVVSHSLREDIDHFVFSEIIKDLITSSSTDLLKKKIDEIHVGSTTNEWHNKEAIDIENSLRDDIDHVVISEIMKDLIEFSSLSSTTCSKTKNCDDEVQQENINKEVLHDMHMSLTKLSESFLDVDTIISRRTNANKKRLEDLNHQFNPMKEEIILLKRKELLYRNAFHRRCYDLQTAEAEVDLLGDEVEFLLGRIKKSYKVLDRYFPDLQYHPEVMEIVNLLKNEVEAELQQ